MFPIQSLAISIGLRSRGQNSEFANFGLPDTAKLEENSRTFSVLLFEPAEIKAESGRCVSAAAARFQPSAAPIPASNIGLI